MGAPLVRMFFLRPQDARATLDALWTDAFFDGHLSDRAFMAGHSFGGYTTLATAGMSYDTAAIEATCADPGADRAACDVLLDPVVRGLFDEGYGDPRIQAAVPMAPPDIVAGDAAAIDMPVLLVTAGMDETLPPPSNGDPIWGRLDGPDDRRLDFPGAGHFTFSDVCTALPGVLRRDGCAPDNTPAAEVHAVVRDVVFAFARRHVLGLSGDEPALDAFSSEIGTLSAH
jgi:predicted dienelactone hydrolase